MTTQNLFTYVIDSHEMVYYIPRNDYCSIF
jgi:hypothetical protein